MAFNYVPSSGKKASARPLTACCFALASIDRKTNVCTWEPSFQLNSPVEASADGTVFTVRVGGVYHVELTNISGNRMYYRVNSSDVKRCTQYMQLEGGEHLRVYSVGFAAPGDICPMFSLVRI